MKHLILELPLQSLTTSLFSCYTDETFVNFHYCWKSWANGDLDNTEAFNHLLHILSESLDGLHISFEYHEGAPFCILDDNHLTLHIPLRDLLFDTLKISDISTDDDFRAKYNHYVSSSHTEVNRCFKDFLFSLSIAYPDYFFSFIESNECNLFLFEDDGTSTVINAVPYVEGQLPF